MYAPELCAHGLRNLFFGTSPNPPNTKSIRQTVLQLQSGIRNPPGDHIEYRIAPQIDRTPPPKSIGHLPQPTRKATKYEINRATRSAVPVQKTK
jgi:hypothetical protein